MALELSTDHLVEIRTPGAILFGVGASESLPERMADFPAGPILMVTDSGLVKAGVVETIRGLLSSTGREVRVFDGVQPDPDKKCVLECLEQVQASDAKLLLGVGGGSSLDVTKVAAALRVVPDVGERG